jgi:hypothetical protein
METMKSKMAIFLLGACLATSAVAAKKAAEPAVWTLEPDSFMGIKLSSNLIYDVKQCPAGYEPPKEMCYQKPYGDLYILNGLPSIGLIGGYQLSAKVKDSAVQYLYLTASSDDFPRLSQVLITKYGKPTRSESEPVKTKAGATFTNEKLSWSGPKVLIVLSKYSDDINTSSVSVTNRDVSMKALSDEKKKISDAASKL